MPLLVYFTWLSWCYIDARFRIYKPYRINAGKEQKTKQIIHTEFSAVWAYTPKKILPYGHVSSLLQHRN
jgi:hypothetical protein